MQNGMRRVCFRLTMALCGLPCCRPRGCARPHCLRRGGFAQHIQARNPPAPTPLASRAYLYECCSVALPATMWPSLARRCHRRLRWLLASATRTAIPITPQLHLEIRRDRNGNRACTRSSKVERPPGHQPCALELMLLLC